jgi:hypothetical protein
MSFGIPKTQLQVHYVVSQCLSGKMFEYGVSMDNIKENRRGMSRSLGCQAPEAARQSEASEP